VNIQELCWLLSEEGFPSLDDGKRFIDWATHKNIDVLNGNIEVVELFKKFKHERLMEIVKKGK